MAAMKRLSLAAVFALLGATFAAQAPATPTFDVATVKPNPSGDRSSSTRGQPGGRFDASNITLRLLIRDAYPLQNFQIIGGPAWQNTDRFDIAAKAPEGAGDAFRAQGMEPSQGQLMIRALLADRFKLVVHTETRELPIYALAVARADRRLGPQLQPVDIDCAAVSAAARANQPAPSLPGRGPLGCNMGTSPGMIRAGATRIQALASALSNAVQRVVIDRTGLSGQFNFELKWTANPGAQGAPGASDAASLDSTASSIFAALEQQLGLKLESTRGPVDVLVIDNVEHPTEN